MTIKLNDSFFNQLLLKASESPRKRSHYNLHKDLNESVQRLCIGLKKGTYVRPHHHPQGNKWELMLVLRGSICLILFDKAGSILEKLLLNPGSSLSGVEMEPSTWHTIFPLTEEAVIIETKEGPYIPTEESDFASWAPAEGDASVMEFLSWLSKAKTGERYSA
jgi:cupin fold WbuC family metalloprotein